MSDAPTSCPHDHAEFLEDKRRPEVVSPRHGIVDSHSDQRCIRFGGDKGAKARRAPEAAPDKVGLGHAERVDIAFELWQLPHECDQLACISALEGANGDSRTFGPRAFAHAADFEVGSLPEANSKPSSAHPVIPPIMIFTGRPNCANFKAARSAPLQCGPAQ